MSNSLLIHLHIPKNAGTTLSRMLKIGVLVRPPTHLLDRVHVLGYYPLVPWEKRIEKINTLPDRRRASIRFFEAHCGYGVQDLLPSPSRIITMLREPTDRTLSVYSFLKENGTIESGFSLEAFLEAPPKDRVWWVDNAQVRYLAGERGQIDQRPIGTCTSDMLSLAKDRLREQVLVTGLVERYEESAVLIRRALGWRKGASVRSNVTKQRTGIGAVPDHLAARIRSLNELDSDLHAYAASLFERRISEAGRTFSDAVARSRRDSARWSRLLGPAWERRTVSRRRRRRAGN